MLLYGAPREVDHHDPMGRIEFRNEILVRRPLAEVFDYIADFRHMPEWNYYVRRVTRVSAEGPGLGATYNQERLRDAQMYRVVEYEADHTIAIVTLPPERRLLMRFSVSTVPDGTRVLDEWELDAGWWTPLAPILRRRMKRAVARNLDSLRELLEIGVTQLPDGRTSFKDAAARD